MLTRLIAYARGLARRRAIESEIDDELAFHLQQETEANFARGMTPDAARREALIGIGGLAQTAAAAREVRRTTRGRDLAAIFVTRCGRCARRRRSPRSRSRC